MVIVDKRGKEEWTVIINSRNCPHLFYPRSDIACKLLEKGKLGEDSYCYRDNCPIRLKEVQDEFKQR